MGVELAHRGGAMLTVLKTSSGRIMKMRFQISEPTSSSGTSADPLNQPFFATSAASLALACPRRRRLMFPQAFEPL
jgi:hypothetical protein